MTSQCHGSSKPQCLVIGGAGFVGQHLVYQLLDQGRYDVSVFDIRLLQDQRARSIQGDLRQPSEVEAACKGVLMLCQEALSRKRSPARFYHTLQRPLLSWPCLTGPRSELPL